MLELEVQDFEGKTQTLRFEHSLRSLSKWESETRKAFYGSTQKLPSEMIRYFQCMLLDPEIDEDLVMACTATQLERLREYIQEEQTASSVPDEGKKGYDPEVRTSELIYFWMTALKINWEAQDWHLSRLMMLIQMTAYKQQPPKKRKPAEVMADWRVENERRRKLLNTSG